MEIAFFHVLQSVFSSLKTWWTTPKQDPQKDTKKEPSSKPTSPSEPSAGGGDRVLQNPNLGPVYERSQMSLSVTQKSSNHPGMWNVGYSHLFIIVQHFCIGYTKGNLFFLWCNSLGSALTRSNGIHFTALLHITGLQLRGFEEEEEDNSPVLDFRESSRRVNAQLDEDLGNTKLEYFYRLAVLSYALQLPNARVIPYLKIFIAHWQFLKHLAFIDTIPSMTIIFFVPSDSPLAFKRYYVNG